MFYFFILCSFIQQILLSTPTFMQVVCCTHQALSYNPANWSLIRIWYNNIIVWYSNFQIFLLLVIWSEIFPIPQITTHSIADLSSSPLWRESRPELCRVESITWDPDGILLSQLISQFVILPDQNEPIDVELNSVRWGNVAFPSTSKLSIPYSHWLSNGTINQWRREYSSPAKVWPSTSVLTYF